MNDAVKGAPVAAGIAGDVIRTKHGAIGYGEGRNSSIV